MCDAPLSAAESQPQVASSFNRRQFIAGAAAVAAGTALNADVLAESGPADAPAKGRLASKMALVTGAARHQHAMVA